MKKIIHNIRHQSEKVRRHILHVSIVVFGVILLLLWIYSLGTNLTNSDTQAKINNNLKPFSALKANLIDGYKSISEPSANAPQ